MVEACANTEALSQQRALHATPATFCNAEICFSGTLSCTLQLLAAIPFSAYSISSI